MITLDTGMFVTDTDTDTDIIGAACNNAVIGVCSKDGNDGGGAFRVIAGDDNETPCEACVLLVCINAANDLEFGEVYQLEYGNAGDWHAMLLLLLRLLFFIPIFACFEVKLQAECDHGKHIRSLVCCDSSNIRLEFELGGGVENANIGMK